MLIRIPDDTLRAELLRLLRASRLIAYGVGLDSLEVLAFGHEEGRRAERLVAAWGAEHPGAIAG